MLRTNIRDTCPPLKKGPRRALGTSPTDADSDNDGLEDGEEVNVHGTDPRDGDSGRVGRGGGYTQKGESATTGPVL